MEPPAHHAGGKRGIGNAHMPPCIWPFDLFVRHDIDLAVAVRQIQQRSVQRPPRVAVDPQQFGGRAIEGVGDPAQRLLHRVVGRIGHVVIAEHVAVEAPFTNPVDAVLGIPVPLLVGDDERAVGIEADAVGRPKAFAQDFGMQAVRAYFEQGAVVWD